MSFYEWLMKQCDDDTAIGDLAEDVRRDPEFPKDVASRTKLISYLTLRGACCEAIEAAREAWAAWGKIRIQMKIYSIEVETNLGRRVVKLSAPIDVEPAGDMPANFRSLTEVLWGLLREIAQQAIEPPKAEA